LQELQETILQTKVPKWKHNQTNYIRSFSAELEQTITKIGYKPPDNTAFLKFQKIAKFEQIKKK
jgi:hypothetical protein